MNLPKLFLVIIVFATSCSHENVTPGKSTNTKLISEEFLFYNPTNTTSSDGFVGSFKKVYKYEQNRLVQIDAYDFNISTNSYDEGYPLEEFHYDSANRLSQRIEFVGSLGLRWIEVFEYLNSNNIKVTRYESNGVIQNISDWWVMERTSSSLTVKYYQLGGDLYTELNCEINEKGNITRMVRNPSFAGGAIYYKYDDSPNPNNYPELSGGEDLNAYKFFSPNNAIEITSDINTKSTVSIQYNNQGYPNEITTSTTKRILHYQ